MKGISWLDAQVGVLGSVLISPELAPRMLAETRPEDFNGECRGVYDAIAALVREAQPVDAMTVRNRLGESSTELLRRLIEVTPTAANYEAYAAATKEQARLDALRRLAGDLGAAVTLDEAREILGRMQDAATERDDRRIVSLSQALTRFYLTRQEGTKEYVDWGLEVLNDRLYAAPGNVIVLGGYPSDGKSAMMLQLAYHLAGKHKVGIFSFETDSETLTDRLVAHVAGLGLGKLKRNELETMDWQKINRISGDFSRQPVDLIEAAGMTVHDILGITLSRQYDVIFIDYVQLISTSGQREGTRQEELAEISKALAVMARRHKVLVVELSQLTRPQAVKGLTPPPTMRSLRESGQLEQDADAVLLLYREQPDSNDSPRVLFVGKNKEGRLGATNLDFDGATQTFSKADSGYSRELLAAEKRRREAKKAGQEEIPT